MSKVSTLTELTSGNIVDSDLLYVVDVSDSASRKVLASSLYAYHLNKLNTANRLVPTLTTSAQYLDGSGAFSTPPNTTYSSMGPGNSYAAGLTPAGSATHAGAFLRQDGSFQEVLRPTTFTSTSRPTFNVTADGSTDGSFSLGATTYLDFEVYSHNHDASSNLYFISFQCLAEVILSGHSSGTTTFQLKADLTAQSITASSTVLGTIYFPTVVYNNNLGNFPVIGNLTTTFLTLPKIDIGITSDGSYPIILAGNFQFIVP